AAEKKAAEKKAAEKKAAEKKAAEKKAAEKPAVKPAPAVGGGTPAQNRELGRQLAQQLYGWGGDQFACYDNIIMRESRWIHTAKNPSSSAYGIPQALPGSKMATAGSDWRTNPATQIRWGLKYVKDRYGSPCKAWSFWQSRHWY
ncbi:MAG TPA: lytic transglycosylase domain-containing protein, partial [Propionibacterium sp.]|nr:lytic transglycosylase domain-containing protein [Propionibacterium sp.]